MFFVLHHFFYSQGSSSSASSHGDGVVSGLVGDVLMGSKSGDQPMYTHLILLREQDSTYGRMNKYFISMWDTPTPKHNHQEPEH